MRMVACIRRCSIADCWNGRARQARSSPGGRRCTRSGAKRMDSSSTLRAIFPSLADTRVSHCWTGNVAMTRSDLAGIGQRDGIWYALGCNGSGVALMPYLGHKVALRVLGKAEGRTAFDDIPFTAVPFYD